MATDYERIISEAIEDCGTIQEAVNEVKIVSPRYGDDFKSIPMLAAEAESTITEWQDAINTITVNDGVPALAVSTANGENQQDINDYTGAKWRNKAGGYALNARVMLDDGDIVRSTVAGNTVDPNVDMAGWVSAGNTIVVESIADLLNINNPKHGQLVVVQCYRYKNIGGGKFVFNRDADKSAHNGGTVIDPLRPYPNDWGNQSELLTWFSASTGFGAWERVIKDGTTLSVAMFGAIGLLSEDSTIPISKAELARSSTGGSLHFQSGNYSFSYLDIASGGSWVLAKKAKLVAAPLDSYQDRARIQITPPAEETFTTIGGVIDGNKSEVLPRRENLVGAYIGRVDFKNVEFINSISSAIRHETNGSIQKCTFKGMAQHTGVAGTTTLCLSLRGNGNIIDVLDSRFYGDPSYPEGANAGGVYSSATNSTVNVRGCFFKDIGQNMAGNFVGCVDLYTNVDGSSVTNNLVINARYQAFKLQNSSDVICSGNTVIDSLHGTHDFNFQPSTRSNNIRKDGAIISGNIGRNSNGISVIGTSDPLYKTGKVVISSNVINGCVTTGIDISYCDDAIVIADNVITNHEAAAITFNNFSGHAEISNNVTKTDSSTSSLFARVNCQDASFTISGGNHISAATPNFSIRDVKSVSLNGVRSNNNIDIQNVSSQLSVMQCTAPAMGGTVTPTGYKTEIGNSWNPQILYASSAPTSGYYPKGTIVFKTTPSASTNIGWVNTGTQSNPVWSPWGAVS